MTILEAENEIAKLKERIETTKLEIEWQQLVGDDCSALLQQKEGYEKRLADLEKAKEDKAIEDASKLSDEYYDKVLVKKIKDNLDVLKARLLNKKSLSKEEQDEVRALAKLQRNTGIINESLNKESISLENSKFRVFAVEDKKANDDTLPIGYDYKGILEMCESLLEANREKYFEIIFYNPEINMVKPELLNWYLEKFDIKSEIERIAKLPAYLIDCISKENFDNLVKLASETSFLGGDYDESLLSIILKSPHVTEKFISDNGDYIFSDDYYFSLVLSNPSISDDFKKEVIKKSSGSFLGLMDRPEDFYYSMCKLDDRSVYSSTNRIYFLSRFLENNGISFKNEFTDEADWIPDYKSDFFNNEHIDLKEYDAIMKLLSFRSVLIGNSLTYNRLDRYISSENLKNVWKVLSLTLSYLYRVTDTVYFSDGIYEYVSDIVDALAVIYSKNGKLDEFIHDLEFYNHTFDERCSRPSDINEKTNNAYLYKLATLLKEKLKYYTDVKDKNQVLISSSDKMYNNDYTIDDIDKMYVKEILGKKEGISL